MGKTTYQLVQDFSHQQYVHGRENWGTVVVKFHVLKDLAIDPVQEIRKSTWYEWKTWTTDIGIYKLFNYITSQTSTNSTCNFQNFTDFLPGAKIPLVVRPWQTSWLCQKDLWNGNPRVWEQNIRSFKICGSLWRDKPMEFLDGFVFLFWQFFLF